MSDVETLELAAAAFEVAAEAEPRAGTRRLYEKTAELVRRIASNDAPNPEEALEAACRLARAAVPSAATAHGAEGSVGHSTGRAQTPAADSAEAQTEGAASGDEPEDPAEAGSATVYIESDEELVQEFVAEANENLDGAEEAILRLEAAPDDADAIGKIFRAFHTVKGVSSFLGFGPISKLAHSAESMLSLVRDGEMRFDGDVASVAFRCVDSMRQLVAAAGELSHGGQLPVPEGYEQLLAEVASVRGGGKPNGKKASEGADQPAPTEAKANAAAAASTPSDTSARATEKSTAQEAKPAEESSGSSARADEWVRVRTDRLDDLMDMVGELVIAQSLVAGDESAQQSSSPVLQRKLAHAAKIVRELQGTCLALRMVPLKGTFQRMARVVRDTARRTGKAVRFETSGEETELDRKLVDALADPLVHMVRNAVDHGVESAEGRAAAGKADGGTVTLRAYHGNGNVVVELADDGAGLSRERLAEKAIERGVISSDQGMSDEEVFALIFEAGFSTKTNVTDVSGRGVGMDVVRKSIDALGGRITIQSELGKGTRFSLHVPLTLAITDGMLVRVGNERYIIPSVNIHMSFRPEPEACSTVTGKGELVMLRGAALPLFRVHDLFGVEGAVADPTEGLAVVVGDGHGQCALLVDELLGKQQVVTKSLGDAIGRVPGVSGGAILGDGRVGLILDPPGLTALARQFPAAAMATADVQTDNGGTGACTQRA